MTLAIIIALLVMAFGSFKDALIIFTGVPLALTGGVSVPVVAGHAAVDFGGRRLYRPVGVAVLNGLVMVAFIRDLWHQNGDLLSACGGRRL